MSEQRYEIRHCDVYETFPGCAVNKTFPLRKQIEGLYLLAGKKVKVKIVSDDEAKTKKCTICGGFYPQNETMGLGVVVCKSCFRYEQTLQSIPSKEMQNHIEKYH